MGRCKYGIVLAIAMAALLAAPASAEEIVHLKNGTYMAISSHAVEGDMLHVTLGADAAMAFPLSMIDRIEVGGRRIELTSEGNTGSTVKNQRVEGETSAAAGPNDPSGTAGPSMTGSVSVPSRNRDGGSPETNAAAMTGGGLVHYRNPARTAGTNGGGTATTQDSAAGNRGIRTVADQVRAEQNRKLPAPGAPTRKAKPISFQPKKVAPAPPKSSSSGGGSDSGS